MMDACVYGRVDGPVTRDPQRRTATVPVTHTERRINNRGEWVDAERTSYTLHVHGAQADAVTGLRDGELILAMLAPADPHAPLPRGHYLTRLVGRACTIPTTITD